MKVTLDPSRGWLSVVDTLSLPAESSGPGKSKSLGMTTEPKALAARLWAQGHAALYPDPRRRRQRDRRLWRPERSAQLFGTPTEWAEALALKARAAKFTSIERVLAGLAVMPLGELVALLAKPHFSSGEEHDRAVARLVEVRADDPLTLAQSALAIGREDYPGGAIREQLLIHAMARLAERNLPIPEGLEKEPEWESFQYCVAPWRGSAVLRARCIVRRWRPCPGTGRWRSLGRSLSADTG